MSVEKIQKVTLGNYPTPLEEMKNLSNLLGKGKLYIKRDDVTGPAMGGNKTRKLEYLLKEALDGGYTAVMTFGGTQTNHGRTTVGAAVKLGLKPILVLGGSDTGYLSGNLTLDALMGADIYFNQNPEKMQDTVKEIVEKYEKQGDKVYMVPVGGSNTLGAVGYIMAIKEIVDQIKEENFKIDYLVASVGSMGTFAGLILGAKYFNAPFKVLGIPIAPAVKEEKIQSVVEYANKISDEYNMGIKITSDDVVINYGPEEMPYCGEAYNKPDSLTREYIIKMAKNEGIFLDPTYTGKTFRGFYDMIENGTIIKENENALFLHTGGYAALWTKEHLDDMQTQLRENSTITQK